MSENWIAGAWLTLMLFWAAGAATAKRAVRREAVSSRLLHIVPTMAAFFLLFRGGNIGIFHARFVPDSNLIRLTGTALTFAGLAFAIWARMTLGGNWSGTITVKQDHQLVRTGPYRMVRHPIYSGILLAMFGTALFFGELRGLIGFAIAFIAWWSKSRTEEQFMLEVFGDQYSRYRSEVKALIPAVL